MNHENNILTFLLSTLIMLGFASCTSTKDTTLSDNSKNKPTFQIFQNGKFVEDEVDQRPEAIAGDKKFLFTMYRKMNYPAQGRQKGIQGTVKIEVIVNELGKLENSKVTKSLGKDFDTEALNAVRRGFELPFKPAMKNGKPIKVKYEIPVNFKLHG